MKRLLFAGVILVAVIVGLTSLRSGSREEIRLAGVVSANEAIVSSEIPGRLLQLLVTEGDPVQKGQVVAVLVADELEAQRANKRALIEQYAARFEQGQEQVRLERERVTSEIESARARVKALESERAENVAELEQWESELIRSQELVRQGLVPRQHQERHETAVEVAEARLLALDDRVAAARAEVEVYRSGERQIRVAEQQVDQIEAQRAQAIAELEQIEVRMGHTELRSPLTGIVSVRAAREGEFVAAGTPVVTVVDLNDTWVRAQVEETYASSLVLGQELNVRLASDDEIRGTVTFISPEAEFATQRDVDRVKRDIRTFGVKVALSNPQGRVHPGMTAFVLLPDGERPSVVSPRPAPYETTRATDLVPEAAAATVPEPEGAPSTASTESDRASEPVPAPRDEELPELVTDDAPPPRRAPTTLPRAGEQAPSPQRTETPKRGDEVLVGEDSDAIDALMDRVASGDASDADMARLEEYLAAELGQENVVLPDRPDAAGTYRAPPARSATYPVAAGVSGENTHDPCPDPNGCETPTALGDAPLFRLEAISVIDGKPAAIINGTRVVEGQTIGEAQVMRILQRSVQLRYQGQSLMLRF